MIEGTVFGFWQWYMILPAVLGHLILPAVIFSFFCRYCRGGCPFFAKWLWCGLYVALSALLTVMEYKLGFKGSLGLALEIVLLACCGKGPGKKKWVETFAVSVLILSVFSVANGIISWSEKRIFVPIIFSHEKLIPLGDGARELLKILGIMALLWAVLGRFGRIVEEGDKRTLGWMTVPVFFIAMVERIIQNSIYGDSLSIDNVSGEISSIIDINHGEMLFLQIFACICLFLALFAHGKIVCIFQETERLKLLKQQADSQELYVQEAAMRYKQTRAFRHDIKNHLAVLEKLLRGDQTEEAWRYLSQLKEAAEELSSGISTGNAAADALLCSKLGLARQEGVEVECRIRIPDHGGIKDMDWCVLLANGADNAIKACREVEKSRKYLKLEGRKKGNFYLITMENSCRRDMEEVPQDGTGLSNIRATAKKYGGRVENQVSSGRYQLKVLLIDSHQEKEI